MRQIPEQGADSGRAVPAKNLLIRGGRMGDHPTRVSYPVVS